jgi:molybdopterin-guanine dinucleotide biosynthesis protein B
MKVFGIAGYSGSGKTTLLEKLIPQLAARGLKVSVIKHAHHGFDIDRPGKDSFRHREAGATEVLLSCGDRWALMHERRDEPEPTLSELIGHLSPCDLVLIEGFKDEPVPKLEVFRAANGTPPLFSERQDIVGIASNDPLTTTLPLLPLDDVAAIACFLIATLKLEIRC